MNNKFDKIFSRLLFKQELMTYLIPVPVIVYFILFYLKVGKENILLVLLVATIASVVALIIGVLIKYLFMKPMLKALISIKNNEYNEELFIKAKKNADILPFVE